MIKLRRILLATLIVCSVFTQSASALGGAYDYHFYSSNEILFYDPREDQCSNAGSVATKLVGDNNRDKIWNYLSSRGLTPIQVAGVMGNLKAESGGTWAPTVHEFEYSNEGDEESFKQGGYGIAQWTHDPGRRGNLISYMNSKLPELMDTYYKVDYSTVNKSYSNEGSGYRARSASTNELMPVADNDELLLAQLDFLYDESSSRPLGQKAIEKGLGTSDNTEWEAIVNADTVQKASDIWLYSFEVPEDIDSESSRRAAAGEVILKDYADVAECPTNSKKLLAQQILDSGNLYYDPTIEPVERNILPDIASGANNGNDWPCGMNILVLKALVDITKEHRIRANSLNRACSNDVPPGSSLRSRHYAGNGSAIDFGPIDNISPYSQRGAQLIVDLMSPYLLPGFTVGQVNCAGASSITIPSGGRRIEDWCTHLHVDVQPNGDPDLRCKTPIVYGGCDETQRI